jgi:acyl-coenzyme A synthetase/AMP-(fatty) acid ligase
MIFEPIKIQAKDNGSKTAIICKDKKYTYSELIKSVEKLAAILSTAIQPDETILFASEKEYHYIRMALACDILGIVFAPIPSDLSDEEVEAIIEEVSPDHIILSEEDASELSPHNKALVYSTDIDKTYTLLFSNRSTPESKAIAHTGGSCLLTCLNSIILHNITEKDVILSQSTISDLYLYSFPGLIKGSTIVMESTNFSFICSEYQPTIGMISSDIISDIDNIKDMSCWREMGISSNIISDELVEKLFEKGVPLIRNLYGHPETHTPSFTFLIKPETEHKLQLECNEQYEYKLDRYSKLWIKTPLMMSKYINMDMGLDKEGYWCSGDVFEHRHNKLFYKVPK